MTELTLRDRLLAADALRREADRLHCAYDIRDVDNPGLLARAAERRAVADKLIRGDYALGEAFKIVEANGGLPAADAEPPDYARGGVAGWVLIEHRDGLYSIERDDNDPIDEIADDGEALIFAIALATHGDIACAEALRFHCRDVVAVAAYI